MPAGTVLSPGFLHSSAFARNTKRVVRKVVPSANSFTDIVLAPVTSAHTSPSGSFAATAMISSVAISIWRRHSFASIRFSSQLIGRCLTFHNIKRNRPKPARYIASSFTLFVA